MLSICSIPILPEPTRFERVVLFRSLATKTQTCSLEIPLLVAEPPRFLGLRFGITLRPLWLSKKYVSSTSTSPSNIPILFCESRQHFVPPVKSGYVSDANL